MLARFLIWGGAPWLIVAIALGIGFLSYRWRRRWGRPRLCLAISVIFVVIGALLALGAGAQAWRWAQLQRLRPAAGQFVDVGGYRAFVLCEGPPTPTTVVWLSGAYSHAYWLKPLHDAFAKFHRSCLIDRPGLGYADDGPLPRTVDRIIGEMHAALHGAGVKSPLVFAGHSMGGLYAANYTQAYPEDVEGLVLLDPTPPQWFMEQSTLYGCPEHPNIQVWGAVFGLALVRPLNPLFGPGPESIRAALAPDWPMIADLETQPRSLIAAISAGYEACRNVFSLVRAPGSLGNVPVLKFVQSEPAEEQATTPQGLSPRETLNWRALRQTWDDSYVTYSTDGLLKRAPPKAGHYFVLTQQPLMRAEIGAFLARIDAHISTEQRAQ